MTLKFSVVIFQALKTLCSLKNLSDISDLNSLNGLNWPDGLIIPSIQNDQSKSLFVEWIFKNWIFYWYMIRFLS